MALGGFGDFVQDAMEAPSVTDPKEHTLARRPRPLVEGGHVALPHVCDLYFTEFSATPSRCFLQQYAYTWYKTHGAPRRCAMCAKVGVILRDSGRRSVYSQDYLIVDNVRGRRRRGSGKEKPPGNGADAASNCGRWVIYL